MTLNETLHIFNTKRERWERILYNFLKSKKYTSSDIQTFSEFGQDILVMDLLNKSDGNYIDIGCGHPTKNNNTYFLEKNGWCGIAFDKKEVYDSMWKEMRKSSSKFGIFKIDDITEIKEYDYCSIDTDGSENIIIRQIFSRNIFPKIMGIENDLYRVNRLEKIKETHSIMDNFGYQYLLSIGVDDFFVRNDIGVESVNKDSTYDIRVFFGEKV